MTSAQKDVLSVLAHLHLVHGQPRQALRLLRLVAAAEPDDVGVLRAFAHALVETGRTQEALPVLDRLERLDAAAARPWLQLLRARALRRAGRLEDARRCFKAFVGLRDGEGLANPRPGSIGARPLALEA